METEYERYLDRRPDDIGILRTLYLNIGPDRLEELCAEANRLEMAIELQTLAPGLSDSYEGRLVPITDRSRFRS